MAYEIRIVSDPASIRQVQALRCEVFGPDYLTPAARRTGKENDPWDLLPQTRHVIIERGDEMVGTARLIFGERIEGYPDLGFKLPLEKLVDLAPLATTQPTLAEISRVCVKPAHRGRGVAQLLYRSAAELCVQHGVARWVGAANTETSEADAAAALERFIERAGLRAEVRCPLRVTGVVVEPGGSEASNLPPILRSYLKWGALSFLASPTYDSLFQRYAIPFIGETRAPLDRIPLTN